MNPTNGNHRFHSQLGLRLIGLINEHFDSCFVVLVKLYLLTRYQFQFAVSTSSGTINPVSYTLQCSSTLISGCENDVYNQTGVQSSSGCHFSCQTGNNHMMYRVNLVEYIIVCFLLEDGCNGFTPGTNLSTSAEDHSTTTTPITNNVEPSNVPTASMTIKTTNVAVTTVSSKVAETTSHGSTVLYRRVILYAALCCVFSLISM